MSESKPQSPSINECRAMQFLAADTYSVFKIGSLLGYHEIAVMRHVNGECQHERPPEPIVEEPMAPAEIRWKRHRAGLTSQELADEVGVSMASVSKWERGKSQPRVHHLRTLRQILDDGLEVTTDAA